MFLSKNPLKVYSMVEALDEAAYVFAPDGTPLGHNARAEELMQSRKLPFSKVPKFSEFTRLIDDHLPLTGTAEFMLGGFLYQYDCRPFSDGTLVRFYPLKDRDHIMRLSTSLNNMPWGILTLDAMADKPVVVFCNQRACDYLDIQPAAMNGQKAHDIFHVFGIQEDLSGYIFGKGVSYYDFEKDGMENNTWYRIHFIPYTQGRRYCLVVLEDTTEGKLREAKYFQSQRLEALGQLAGGVAHDFNNILSIIDGYARLAKKSCGDNAEVKNCLERISQAVQRASAIAAHLLTFGTHKIVKDEVCDLGQVIEDQQALIRPIIDASINLAIRVENNLFIDAPQDSICQILLNLCVNSRDSMADGGDLIVEAGRRNAETVFLRVIDTGCGMSPEVRNKMFDPFFTTKDQGKGTGLGLSVVYGIVKDMHGEIDVLSHPGAGTSITVWIPAAKGVPHAEQSPGETESAQALKGYTVLVSEDEPDLLNMLSVMLKDLGLNVLTASNGNEALRIQQDYEGRIDFLLTDVVMPELNGVKLSDLFSALRPATKTVFMSGYPANGQMARVPLPHNAILLPKPVQFESLAAVLKGMAAQKLQNGNTASISYVSGQWRSNN